MNVLHTKKPPGWRVGVNGTGVVLGVEGWFRCVNAGVTGRGAYLYKIPRGAQFIANSFIL